VRLNPKKSKELFADVKHDHIQRYLREYPKTELPKARQVR
jgi:hypothetical protein